MSNVNAQGAEPGFRSLSCRTRDDDRQPEIEDTVLSITLGILAQHWKVGTETKARGGVDAIVLSTETWINLYCWARRCAREHLTPSQRR